eukprot:m.26090 g.26090  ORF g.26090 m.26090 type:complete len:412 (+) comp9972_c0_seq4:266-1501(+)
MSSDIVRKLLEREDVARTLMSTRVLTTTSSTTTATSASTPGSPMSLSTASSTTITAATVPIADRPVLILHMGRRYTKAGFAGEDVPRCIVKTAVCTHSSQASSSSGHVYGSYSGCEEGSKTQGTSGKDVWLLGADVDRSQRQQLLTDFFHQLYNKHLLVKSPEHRVLLCKDYIVEDAFFEDVRQVLQTSYMVPEVSVHYSHELALYALGTDTALMVDCGDVSTYCLAVSKTYTVVKSLAFADKGSRTVRNWLRVALEAPETLSEDDVEDIQVRACFACRPQEGVTASAMQYDRGEDVLTIPGEARVACADCLFEDSEEGSSLQSLILETVAKSPVDDRKALASNIVLLGGTTQMRGFRYRLLTELKNAQASPENDTEETATLAFGFLSCPFPPNILVWMGASIASALPNFQ